MSLNRYPRQALRGLLAASIVLATIGCETPKPLSSRDFVVEYRAAPISLGQDIGTLGSVLSGISGVTRFESVYQRNQTIYTLEGLEVGTYENLANTVDWIQILSGNLSTSRGITLGDDVAKVLARYPKPTYSNSSALVFSVLADERKGVTDVLTLQIEDGHVKKISFNVAGP